jgi:hypothetical protein
MPNTYFSRLLTCFSLTFFCLSASAQDSVVSVEVAAAGLPLVLANDLPCGGTFWMVSGSNGVTAPFPCAPVGVGSDNTYILPNGAFLVDATAGETGLAVPQLVNQWNSVSNLIVQSQAQVTSRTKGFHAMDDFGVPGPGDSGMDDDYTNPPESFGYNFDTNQLWLEITNVSGGWAYLNAHNATNQVYGVWGTTNLLIPFTNWTVLTELWPTTETTNVLPFAISTGNNANLFMRAEDWTGVYTNGLPVWWLWNWFGGFNKMAGDIDSQGNTLGDDYTNGINPNILGFAMVMTNNYVNTAYPTVQLDIFAGIPDRYAVLVNDTNQADAVWQPYSSSNVLVILGADGKYDVSIGLSGSASGELVAWQDVQLTKDTVPPILTITNPVSGTLFQPLIQLQGFANEQLSQITFDVSNAAGIFTNQMAYVTGEFFDTNLLASTTNWFQCYDVSVTNGLNVVTLHAFDVAGNETTTNLNYILDYSSDTNMPVLSLIWPQPNALIGGSNFTLQATVDDDTATVFASITDTNGDTNIVMAVVERNGNVWAENLPLMAGTNTVTLTATNAAGVVSTTNFMIVQSPVTVTIDPISSDQLSQPTVSVTGSVSDPSQNIWVNGLAAYYTDEAGDWEADGVAVNLTGLVNLTVQAGAGTNAFTSVQTAHQVRPAIVAISRYALHEQERLYNPNHDTDYGNYADNYEVTWTYSGGGAFTDVGYNHGTEEEDADWNNSGISDAGEAGLSENGGFYLPGTYALDTPINNEDQVGNQTVSVQTQVAIQPQGMAVAGQTALYLVQAQVLDVDSGAQLVASAVKFLNQLTGSTTTDVTNADGSVWTEALVAAPAGVSPEVTPYADGYPNISFNEIKLSLAKIIYFSVLDNGNIPSSFRNNLSVIRSTLQSELNGNIFNNLVTGQSVQIKVNIDSHWPGSRGWSDASKHIYVNQVNFGWGNVPYNKFAENDHGGGIDINLNPIVGITMPTQGWLNYFAHEGIWGNVAGKNDDNGQADSEISSGTQSYNASYTVAPSSRLTILKACGLNSN